LAHHLDHGIDREGHYRDSKNPHEADRPRKAGGRALHALEKSGPIKIAYRAITVLDIEGLRGFGG
jgi:hypothetical protein